MFIETYDEYWGEGYAVAAFPIQTNEKINEIKEWCRATFGEPGDHWEDDIHWGEVRFDDKKDLMMFVLRWS